MKQLIAGQELGEFRQSGDSGFKVSRFHNLQALATSEFWFSKL
jgi:hypothetical protein